MDNKILKNYDTLKNSYKIRDHKKFTEARNEIERYFLNYIKNKENLKEVDILEYIKIEIFGSISSGIFTIYIKMLITYNNMLKYTFEIDIQKNILYIKKLNHKNSMYEVIEKIENFIK